ncbi:molybdopterin synthase small subunit CnxG [Hypoxylon fragiforme]|uniref:molybdopterin synthase small subunit CnxG n=1 Tax=Hypoxylon fragiforme TaxID=63214 RepID=UPI0020C6F9F2|nr:molybdopterin synthase small subunit CnxG [Hypoxylon fragiforme]KAI2614079.1 molybdopterin synthase small subunit CnxG [Hypoxylon fragiforme]
MGAIPKPPKGHFNILYFASASSFTSKEFETLPAPLPLWKFSCLVTVNLDYVDIPDANNESSTAMIEDGDEVAIIPPVSSG